MSNLAILGIASPPFEIRYLKCWQHTSAGQTKSTIIRLSPYLLPDDILNDKGLYHTFKLFTDDEFTDCEDYAKETHVSDNKKYYRATGGGGLPYKVDHLHRIIRDMIKLRDYNDSFSMQQVMYQLLLLSHYVVDAHVPMHCDIRDDEPSSKKPSGGNYYKTSWHGKIEKLWDEACTPVGISEDIIDRERAQDGTEKTEISPFVTFNIDNDVGEIKTYHIPQNKMMEFVINLCIKSKERSLKLFPIADPNIFQEDKFNALTRDIFASSIGDLISIWICIWGD